MLLVVLAEDDIVSAEGVVVVLKQNKRPFSGLYMCDARLLCKQKHTKLPHGCSYQVQQPESSLQLHSVMVYRIIDVHRIGFWMPSSGYISHYSLHCYWLR